MRAERLNEYRTDITFKSRTIDSALVADGVKSLSCPVCDGKVDVPDDALEGELFECASCGAQLEYYLEGERPKLKMAEEVAEDWGE